MDFTNVLKDKYNIELNLQQQEAVNNINGPCLLLSVPGGGKTTVIVSRIANMIINHKIPSGKILTLTFSRASAIDMKNRFDKIFGKDISSKVEFSTIHSFCYSVINDYVKRNGKKFPVLIEGNNSSKSRSKILKQIYFDSNKELIGENKLEEISNKISYVKNMLLTPEQIKDLDTGIDNFAMLFNAYEKFKRDQGYIDYDDMLTDTYELFIQQEWILNIYREKYHYINIDESQDTSFTQHELIRLLAQPKNNIFMVGDEDQSIYAFRAAFPQALLDFKKTYLDAKILLMERNYRSKGSIVKVANHFIKQNKQRYMKEMFTKKEDGNCIKFVKLNKKIRQYKHLISAINTQKCFSECVILYRNNISAITVVDFLDRHKIPFYMREANNNFFKHGVVKDIFSFIKLGRDSTDIASFEQIYYKLNAYLSKNMFEFVSSNYSNGKNIFEILLSFPRFSQKTKDLLVDINKNIQRIPKMKPYDAIIFIENTLNYNLFIRKMGKEKGNSPEGINQILDSIKIIAANTETFEDFFKRFLYLQQVIEDSKKNKHENAVVLSTIHSCKGLEFDNVYIIDLIEGQFPSSTSISEFENNIPQHMEEEVRLFYVGVTRARKHLEIITYETSNDRKIAPSRFVKQLLDAQKKLMKGTLSTFFSDVASKIASMLQKNSIKG